MKKKWLWTTTVVMTILEANCSFLKAKIDNLVQKNTLAVIEVKPHLSLEFELPFDFATPKKIQRLAKDLDVFVSTRDLSYRSPF